MNKWATLATREAVTKTIEALKTNGIDAQFVETGAEAKEKVLSLIPQDSEVFNQTSVTLDSIGIPPEINGGKFNSVHNKLMQMDRSTQSLEMQKLGAAPQYALGSVHAVTQDGKVLIASNTGSQLTSYVYGAAHVIWVVGTQKIVANLDEGVKRIYEYVLPLESERVKKTYGMEKSNVSKLLIINKEVVPERITLLLVNEKLGF